MPSLKYSSPFPIVFICDHSNRSQEIPEYTSEAVASFTNSCVSIRTISDVDGEVTVYLEPLSEEGPCKGIEVYSGHIDAPGGRIAVVDSEDTKLLESDCVGVKPFVRVLVDDEIHPTVLWIEVQAM